MEIGRLVKGSRIAAVAFVAGGVFGLAQGGSHAAATQGPRTLIVDQHAIMNESKMGQDVRRQLLAYENQLNTKLGGAGQSLQKESQQLQQEAPTLPVGVRTKKTQALQAREAAYQQEMQTGQSLIQGGQMVAFARYKTELGLVLHAIMAERGADLVVYKSSVAESVPGADITREAIQRLDRRISSFKVPLVKPPADAAHIAP